MDREKFVDFLFGKNYSRNSVFSRSNAVSRVEREYNISIENVVTNKEKTLDLIEQIMSDNRFTETQKKNFPNAVICYYEYVNGSILGTLKENNRR